MFKKNIQIIIWTVLFIFGGMFSCSVMDSTPSPQPGSETPQPNPEALERIDGIDYLHDETVSSFACGVTNNGGVSDLIISEVTRDWIEIYNTREAGADPICLENYRLRTSTIFSASDANNYYSLPNYAIEAQSYVIIRFNFLPDNSTPNIIIVGDFSDLSLFISTSRLSYDSSSNGRYSGFFEITMGGQSVDFIGFCQSDGNLPVSPLTGTFSGCVDYTGSTYLSFSRSLNLTDTDNAEDWTSSTIPTFGGENDVTDDTDNDRDGIPDANEAMGTTFAGMPLYDWGARINQRDIFVHISYMDGKEVKNGLAPPKAALEKVRDAFSNNGFAIHMDVGNLYSSSVAPSDFNMSGQSHEVLYSTYTTLDEIAITSVEAPEASSVIYYKNRYVPINRFGLFHHALFANKNINFGTVSDSTLGIAELPGNDFIVFLGWNEDYNDYPPTLAANYTAAVFFHELGHNLSLRHGGADNYNYKLNHLSSMNYGYTLIGIPETNDSSPRNFYNRYLRRFQQQDISSGDIDNYITNVNFKIDYSHGVMPTLNENSLSEVNPLGVGLGNVDWNNNEVIETTNYAFNINPIDTDTSLTVMEDYDEWGNLKLPFDYNGIYPLGGYNSLTSPRSGFQGTAPRFKYLKEGQSSFIQCSFPGHNH